MFQVVGCRWKVCVCAAVLAAVAVTVEPANSQEKTQESAPEKPQLAAQDNAREAVQPKPDIASSPVQPPKPDSVQKPPSSHKPDFARYLARPDGSMPMIHDWSTRHVIYTANYTDEQADKMAHDPRALAAFVDHGIVRRHHDPITPRRVSGLHPVPAGGTMKRDWAVSLGNGLVAEGLYPAKYSFDVNAPPSCTEDFVVFPLCCSTGGSRANVTGTFSGLATIGQTVSVTITPTGSSPATLTLTAGTTNAGTMFDVNVSGNVTAVEGANLAAAINRNLSSIALDEIAAATNGGAVTVYALTPGTGVTLSTTSNLSNFSWSSVTTGTNGSQASIVGFNNLYAGSGSPQCVGHTYPTFTFSYAAGAGRVDTSPVLSLDGRKIAFVENDGVLGTILHVLTLGTGTEYGSCTNSGTAAPTCATAAVIPGSTAGSNATDYMLPLDLVGDVPAPAGDYYTNSSPFVDYQRDVLYLGNNFGDLFSVSPVFGSGTPALRGGFPVLILGAGDMESPIVDVGNTDNIFIESASSTLYSLTSGGVLEGSLSLGEESEEYVHSLILDSTNGVGYTVAECNTSPGGDSVVFQFSIPATGSPEALATAELSTADCNSGNNLPDPTPDNNYFTRGISSSSPSNNGELIAVYAGQPNGTVAQFQFTSGIMSPTAEYAASSPGNSILYSPLTEFYGDDQAYTIGSVAQSGNTVTVMTTANAFVSNQVVVISGLGAGTGGCTSAAADAINGEQTVTVASPTTFAFTSPMNTAIGGANGNCNLTSALATGATQDYLFYSSTQPEMFAFDLPLTSSTQTPTATNTTSVFDGPTGIVIDNDSTDGQASSIYFGTENNFSTPICGSSAMNCAIKLTQTGLN